MKKFEETLNALNADSWKRAIHKIDENFSGAEPEICEQLHEVLSELLYMSKTDPEAPLKSILSTRLSRLECWNTRAVKIDGGRSCYWNPLNESFSSFNQNGEASLYKASTPYPSSDIIKSWVNETICST